MSREKRLWTYKQLKYIKIKEKQIKEERATEGYKEKGVEIETDWQRGRREREIREMFLSRRINSMLYRYKIGINYDSLFRNFKSFFSK